MLTSRFSPGTGRFRIYEQNFEHLGWRLGYAFPGLIVLTTIGQLVFFRWKRWI